MRLQCMKLGVECSLLTGQIARCVPKMYTKLNATLPNEQCPPVSRRRSRIRWLAVSVLVPMRCSHRAAKGSRLAANGRRDVCAGGWVESFTDRPALRANGNKYGPPLHWSQTTVSYQHQMFSWTMTQQMLPYAKHGMRYLAFFQ